jgi:hypothetical protein
MKKIFFLLVFPLSSTCFSQTIADSMDSIITRYANNNDFIGSVLIAKDDTIILKKGYGYSDIQNKTLNTSSTIYCIASITKLFTSSSIRLLEEQGLLKMDDPLSKYIPDYPYGNKIFISNLISNTSGIADYINELHDTITNEKIKLDSIINIFKYKPLNFEPGEKYSYCNSGWILLAYIIEKVSGMSYSDFVMKNIFEKIDMKNTFSDWDYSKIKLANGYHKENGEFVQNGYFSASQIIGTGNVVSTVEDLYQWYISVYKTEKDCMKYQFRFNGCFGGYKSTLFINRITNSVYIILANYDLAPLDSLVDELDNNLIKKCYSKSVDSLEKQAGYYFAGESYYLIIEKSDNSLIAYSSAIGQPVEKYTLEAVSVNRFIKANDSFEFTDSDSLQFNKINATWGCNTYPYIRANYHFDKEEAKKYSGKFQFDNGKNFTISYLNNDCLLLEIENSSGLNDKYIARGAYSNNFIYPYSRLIFDDFDESKYQTIKTYKDGTELKGRRIK